MSDDAPTSSDAPPELEPLLTEDQRRTGAQKLAALLRAIDQAGLRRFRKQRMAADSITKERDLAHLRMLLELVTLQLEEDREQAWPRVERACALLREVLVDEPVSEEPPESDEEAAADAAKDAWPARPSLDTPPPPAAAASSANQVRSPWLGWSRGPSTAANISSAPPAPSEPPSMPPEEHASEPPPWLRSHEIAEPERDGGGDHPPNTQPNPDSGNTGPYQLPARHPALPFASGDDDGPTKQITYASMAHGLALDVESYAALCAESDVSPERRLEIHERYEVSGDRTRDALQRAFELRFARDPSLRSLWQQHYVRFKTALQKRR
jgi:hypothetical protein